MKIICHRGNTFGPDPENENKPEVIDYCIRQGYGVEIDLRVFSNNLFLGHNTHQYPIDLDYLLYNYKHLWIHCKNYEALFLLSSFRNKLNYFFHNIDAFTITSRGFIWTHPTTFIEEGSLKEVKLDLKPNVNFNYYKTLGVYGVCVDYV